MHVLLQLSDAVLVHYGQGLPTYLLETLQLAETTGVAERDGLPPASLAYLILLDHLAQASLLGLLLACEALLAIHERRSVQDKLLDLQHAWRDGGPSLHATEKSFLLVLHFLLPLVQHVLLLKE